MSPRIRGQVKSKIGGVIMKTEKVEALMRLRELLIKRNDRVGEVSRIGEYVQSLVDNADQAEEAQFTDIARDIEVNRLRVDVIMREAEAARPQLLAEIERITEILGEKVILDELAKHPIDTSLSVN